MRGLRILSPANPPLTIPSVMSNLESLRAGKLRGTLRLQIACGLNEFPREVFELADTLEILDLSGNALSTLPADLPRLHKLRVIFCSDNQFTELPEVLGQCAQLSMVGFKANRISRVPPASLPKYLRWLILTDNAIESLPAELGHCAQLQKLMLAGNRLTELPATLASCARLELLRIAANQLEELPDWLLALPRLSWLAYAGNPFSAANEAAATAATFGDHLLPDIDWSALRLQQQLGEGASGVIHQAEHHPANGTEAVAVKVFKGAITSDGLPRCEMVACLSAGQHPNLVPVRGTVQNHPTYAQGLVMSLIDPVYRNLAGPPSLTSCTRDCYMPDWRIDLSSALSIALGMASAARHLHRRGILHGDLYAHNILHNGHGHAFLGDFGAASFYTPASPIAECLQRIEVRAFGCLLEELLAHCTTPSGPKAQVTLAQLGALKTACLSDQTKLRPLFGGIEDALAVLQKDLRL